MTIDVPTLREGPRGCGYRRPGGMYLVSSGLSEPCDRLPLPVEQCPTCGHGVKPARGWTWLDGEEFFAPAHVQHGSAQHDLRCPLGSENEVEGKSPKDLSRVGLIWIGEKFYATPEHFAEEAARMGVSRRISQIPRGFEPGVTWVFLAHRRAIATRIAVEGEAVTHRIERTPGVFRVFRPERIEYVVKGDETEEELARLVERGLTPVIVERVDPTPEQIASGLFTTTVEGADDE